MSEPYLAVDDVQPVRPRVEPDAGDAVAVVAAVLAGAGEREPHRWAQIAGQVVSCDRDSHSKTPCRVAQFGSTLSKSPARVAVRLATCFEKR
jgi:hypothetical protein